MKCVFTIRSGVAGFEAANVYIDDIGEKELLAIVRANLLSCNNRTCKG